MKTRPGGRLAIGVGPVQIGFGNAVDLFDHHAHENGFLDPAGARQEGLPPVLVIDFEHHRANQFPPLGDQWVIGGEFVVDLRLAALFDVQHFVNLPPHCVVALKIAGREGADFEPAMTLERDDLGLLGGADGGEIGRRHNIGAGDLGLFGHAYCLNG